MESLKSEFYQCDCHSDEHLVKITPDFEDSNSQNWRMYLTIHLVNWRSFWKRLGIATKYLFGYKCKFGNWDEIILSPEDCIRLQKTLELFNKSVTEGNHHE